jgi:hypothetical protein
MGRSTRSAAVNPTYRFLLPEGDIDIVAVLAAFTKRLSGEYPTRSEIDIACDLNREVATEKALWARAHEERGA